MRWEAVQFLSQPQMLQGLQAKEVGDKHGEGGRQEEAQSWKLQNDTCSVFSHEDSPCSLTL